mmetsp:Transcript_91398/g.272762  ORF Transcript_91398/g.272762 Transcript_91398/m.272762 type:complete len:250 (-) Transcript_91398:257-1006(-)
MRLGNIDIDEADRGTSAGDPADELEFEDCPEAVEADSRRSFFDLRQRTLVGMDQLSAFRIVALGLLRKLQSSARNALLYREVEDALNRYLRILESDMQKFVSLHDILHEAAEKLMERTGSSVLKALNSNDPLALLEHGMHEIAAVLLACSQMQKRALDLKVGAQHAISESGKAGAPPLVSFGKLAEFLQEALAICDQLRRKHEGLQQVRMRAMASLAEARAAASAADSGSAVPQGSRRSKSTSAAAAAP